MEHSLYQILSSQSKSKDDSLFNFNPFNFSGFSVSYFILWVSFPLNAISKGDTEVIKTVNGVSYFAESEFRSAPYFDLKIDGISLLNTKF
jgi:hypothetical protein